MPKFWPLLILAVAGCYDPNLKSPGYYCHEEDRPACPGDQVCVSGRCQNKGAIKLDGGAKDMGGMGDMRGMTGDMKTVNTMGCAALAACIRPCTTQACITACQGMAATASKMLYDTALGCEQNYCITAGKCKLDTTMTMLIDNGTPAGKCNTCLTNATAALFGDTCVGTTDCNPSTCTSDVNACLAD